MEQPSLYRVHLSEPDELDQLEHTWLSIQKTVEDIPFFLTWTWISCWLDTYKPHFLQVTAYFQETPVCIGLLTLSHITRRNLIRSRQLRLHQTGIPSQDQIWIEYNDFLAARTHRHAAVTACLLKLETLPDWDEMIISMMPRARSIQLDPYYPHIRRPLNSPAYGISLHQFERDPARFLPTLSTNTRYQINKSARIYEQAHGSLSLEIADTQTMAIDFFHLAGQHHKTRWPDSGFKNTEFVQFHERLIRATHASKQTRLMRISAGDQLIGVLYFLLDSKIAYFYLQGLNYGKDPKLKPGLLSHSLAIQHFIAQGIRVYDFMGGHSQYKLQLGSFTQQLDMVLIQRPRVVFWLENLARNLKATIITALKNSHEQI
ncbi:Protein involved in cellulose biosynthesis (CelD) [Thiorhodovibrio winogradskyi]|uniref:Protein involved in cellulose biosynthesis (CelD) n=1 Tax=Thiorhodovibrio winogradskyi TaxID=77007 RepID=A0ABZ0SBE9_9GAMM|nr:GNAT family N-acetyltransferase [Thiorhodovibrio winogradskyi]